MRASNRIAGSEHEIQAGQSLTIPYLGHWYVLAIDQPMPQPTNQPINQPTNQSTNQSINHHER
jgi:hypothetical protein